MGDALAQALHWRATGLGVARATVIRTWGSSARPAGSQLVVNQNSEFEGSVSGGCVDVAVVEAGLEVIRSGEPRLLAFGVTDEAAWAVGLPCGGRIEVYVERLEANDQLLEHLQGHRAASQPVVLVTQLSTGRHELVRPDQSDTKVDSSLRHYARDALRRDSCLIVEREGDRVFFQPFDRPLRMIVVGAVHIAQHLSRMAADSGYEVVVVDPRRAFNTVERFSGVTLRHEWPDDALRTIVPDHRTAVVALTHDPKLDEPSLAAALRSDAFYIGALGSRRTQRARLDRLRKQGFGDADLARVHGPVGLDIGAQSPAEIAVSILAQVTQTLRGGRP